MSIGRYTGRNGACCSNCAQGKPCSGTCSGCKSGRCSCSQSSQQNVAVPNINIVIGSDNRYSNDYAPYSANMPMSNYAPRDVRTDMSRRTSGRYESDRVSVITYRDTAVPAPSVSLPPSGIPVLAPPQQTLPVIASPAVRSSRQQVMALDPQVRERYYREFI